MYVYHNFVNILYVHICMYTTISKMQSEYLGKRYRSGLSVKSISTSLITGSTLY